MSSIVDIMINSYRSLIKVNVKTRMINIYKAGGKIWPTPDAAIDGNIFLEQYIQDNNVFEEDLWQFERLADVEILVERCRREQSNAILAYRRVIDADIIWYRVEMMVPENYTEENPEILVLSYEFNMNEASFYDSCYTIAEQYHKVLRADLTNGEYIMLKQLPAEAQLNAKLYKGSFDQKVSYGRENYVHPDDLPAFQKAMDRQHLLDYFDKNTKPYQIYYRRRIGSLYRWVKLTMLPAQYCSKERQVYYVYIEDVHREIIKAMDAFAGASFTKAYTGESDGIDRIYYDNLLEILSSLIQNYAEFNLIDLEKDLIIRYRISSSILNERMPYVSRFSEAVSRFGRGNIIDEDSSKIDQVDSPEKIQNLLKDRMTMSFDYRLKSGKKIRSVFRKLEAERGVPTRVLNYTNVIEEEHPLIVRTFGNFEVMNSDHEPIHFPRKHAKQILAYLIDRQGYPVTSKDIVTDVLEKSADDLNALKYVSTLVKTAIKSLEDAGYKDVIIKEQKMIRVDTKKVDCDYYKLIAGDATYWESYNNEYMKEYSWAEETNAEIMDMAYKT